VRTPPSNRELALHAAALTNTKDNRALLLHWLVAWGARTVVEHREAGGTLRAATLEREAIRSAFDHGCDEGGSLGRVVGVDSARTIASPETVFELPSANTHKTQRWAEFENVAKVNVHQEGNAKSRAAYRTGFVQWYVSDPPRATHISHDPRSRARAAAPAAARGVPGAKVHALHRSSAVVVIVRLSVSVAARCDEGNSH
jgi:hypothetical protein